MGGENPSEAPFDDGSFPGNVLEKNKIVDGVFSEEAESDMDGDESFSFSLLNGKPQIKISPKVLEEARHQWKNSLIVTLLGKAIKYDALCNKACALWNLRGGFKALDLGENYFLFTFQSMEDRMRVYTEGPWVVMDHFLSVCKWEPNFKPSEGRRILRAAVWVRFLELPVEFLHDEILYHVAKSLGRPIKVDHSAQGKFARVCIEINLSKPLCPVIEVEGKDCTVEYEYLHSFCFDRNCFGQLKVHNRDGATILEEAEHKTNQLEIGSKTIREDELDTVKPKETEKANDSLSDPASLPSKLDEIDIPKDLNVEVETLVNFEGDSHDCEVKDETKSDSRYEIPDTEFCDFLERTPEEFLVGDIWALYNNVNELPNCYGFIKKIDFEPECKLHVTLLIPCPGKNPIQYADKRPVGCGIFIPSKGGKCTDSYDLSHRINVKSTDKMREFAIFPKTSEIWAVYKNWTSRMTLPDLEKCEYDLVEVVEVNEFVIKGLVLEMVTGYNCVFKARKINESLVTIQIIRPELIKFSHQIPAFRLTDEEGGSLRGYLELDPYALPDQFLVRADKSSNV